VKNNEPHIDSGANCCQRKLYVLQVLSIILSIANLLMLPVLSSSKKTGISG
jgi:hypothetical protein